MLAVASASPYIQPKAEKTAPYFSVNRKIVCVKTPDLKDQLDGFESMWAGANLEEDTLKVSTIVELYTNEDNNWMLIEHFPKKEVSCVIGIGEDWAFNPRFSRKRGVGI